MNFKMTELKRCILLSALLTAAALGSSLYRLATDGPQVESKSLLLSILLKTGTQTAATAVFAMKKIPFFRQEPNCS